ncbi:helix-turn-helix domain-containing protein [Stutzerimonas chloritidismutans]|uniref:helix-turn-helix domain-containing protein n=1 Tax=Stutzerimonas chloritidismutans TaxID=203192 RepID=UPI003F5CE56B
MLSQAIYWSKRTDNADGWFYKTMEEWASETGMTRSEQESARKKLVSAGVLEEKKKGVPCRLFYRVNMDAIRTSLIAENPHSSLQDSCKQGCRKAASKPAGKPLAITETTAEITAETTTDTFPGQPADAALPVVVDASPRVEIQADIPGPKDPSSKTFKAWANYAFAYRKRYSVWPKWNAKAAGQISQLVDRLGADEAHHVAAFYVTVNDARLVNDCHSLNNLLAKCEAFHTQWATGRQMNATTARQIEATQANINAAQELVALFSASSEGCINANRFL